MTLKRKHDATDSDDDDIQILGVINDNISEEMSDIEDIVDDDVSNASYASDYRKQTPKKMIKTGNDNNNNNIEPISPKELNTLQKLLLNAQPSQDYLLSGEIADAPSSIGLFVKGVGLVPVPISEHHANQLSALNPNTTSNTNKIEFNADSIEIQNPDWTKHLHKLTDKVCEGLGLKKLTKICTKLNKLILHKPGSKVPKSQTDTKTDKQCFAKLIIQLPSVFQGGEIVVHKLDQTYTKPDLGVSTQRAPFFVHYVSLYNDAEHEVSELTSRYRLLLDYDLCCDDEFVACNLDAVKDVCQELKKISASQNLIGVVLENKYDAKSVKQGLIACDRDRFELLRNANSMLSNDCDDRFEINVVHACLVIKHYDMSQSWKQRKTYEADKDPNKWDYCDWEELSRFFVIKEWFAADGSLMFNMENKRNCQATFLTRVFDLKLNRVLEEKDFVDSNCYAKNDIRVKYTGSCCEERMIKLCSKFILVLVPKRRALHFYSMADFGYSVRFVREMVFDNSMPKDVALAQVRSIMNEMSLADSKAEKESFLCLLEIVEKIGDLDLLREFLKSVPRMFECLLKPLANLVARFEWENLSSSLKSLFNSSNCSELALTCKFVKELVTIDQREKADLCFHEFVLPLVSDEKAFMELKYKNGLESYHSFRRNDLSFIDTIFSLLETLILINNEETEASISQLFNMISNKLDQDEIKLFIAKLKPQFETLKMYKPIVQLFQERVNDLKDKTAKEPLFSWKMRGATGDATVDHFLESEKQSITYCNFVNIKNARRFISQYSGLKHDQYSVLMCECGRGKSSGVQITKTKELFDANDKSQTRMINEFKSEITDLLKLIFSIESN